MSVSVGRAGDDLLIRIEDDGAGANVAEVEAARGHGIDLLTRRLEALYGQRAGLRYDTSPGRGFGVDVRLPFDRIGPADPTARAGKGPNVLPLAGSQPPAEVVRGSTDEAIHRGPAPDDRGD